MAKCFCDLGWICEGHPDKPWPHAKCVGPGMHCLNPACQYGKENLAQRALDEAHNREHYPNGLDERGQHHKP